MGKKKTMKLLPFSFKTKETAAISSWPWPACGTPRTISFRAAVNNDVFKTINSAYVDGTAVDLADDTRPDLYYYINPSESFSSVSEGLGDESAVETVIRGLTLRSSETERLFFEPGETSSILEEAKLLDDDDFPFKESVAMAVDSRDPFVDFRRSMEEMVEAHGLKDWECLEDLLTCYLRVNGKSNHGYIVGAFVDLLVSIAFAASTSTSSTSAEDHPNCSASSITHSFTSPLSFSSTTTTTTTSTSTCSPSLSLVEVDDETEKSDVTVDNASSSSSITTLMSHLRMSD